MASVATSYKRLFVRVALKNAQDAGDKLSNVLIAYGVARIQATSTGKILVATSANGHSHNWQIPSEFNTQDAADLVSEILDRYDEAVAKLIADGTDSPTDQQIYDEIMDKLQAVRSYASDFSLGRLEQCESA